MLLTAGASLLVFGLLQGGIAWPWGSQQSLLVLGTGDIGAIGSSGGTHIPSIHSIYFMDPLRPRPLRRKPARRARR